MFSLSSSNATRHGWPVSSSASVIIGVVWAVWHVPLALVPDSPQGLLPFGWYAVNVVAFSVIFTWMFNYTGWSLLPVTLLHASIQVSNVLVP